MSCQGKGSCQDLQKKLTPQQFRVTQEKGTEIVKPNCIVSSENHF
jgi:peptide methionine sulfoxide reductase MsrB